MYGVGGLIARQLSNLRRSLPGSDYINCYDSCPVLAIWDDHDYGANDAGADFPMREVSQQLFLDFWNVPLDSARRAHPGVYDSWMIGPAEHQVQILLLDTRYFCDPFRGVRSLPLWPEAPTSPARQGYFWGRHSVAGSWSCWRDCASMGSFC